MAVTRPRMALALALSAFLTSSGLASPAPQAAGLDVLTAARSVRCTFPLGATGTWRKEGTPTAAVKPTTLVLVFDSIDVDEGTARLKSGSAGSEITVKASGGYLHFVQAFRTGPLYTTTVFAHETAAGRFKAAHSRHEYFSTPLAGATSSPEQYYGECEAVN